MISISMPNYNKDIWVKEAIQSIIDQSFTDWELLFIDDCSTDDSLKYAKEFKDSRIKIIKLNKNSGLSVAHAIAINKAKGDWIAIVDSDDILIPKALKTVNNKIQKLPKDIGFIYSKYQQYDMNMNPTDIITNHFPIINNSIIYDKKAISHLKVFRKKDYMKSVKVNFKFIKAWDKALILVMEEVTNFAFIDEVLYKYRYTNKGISTTISGNKEKAEKYFNMAIYEAKQRRKLI